MRFDGFARSAEQSKLEGASDTTVRVPTMRLHLHAANQHPEPGSGKTSVPQGYAAHLRHPLAISPPLGLRTFATCRAACFYAVPQECGS